MAKFIVSQDRLYRAKYPLPPLPALGWTQAVDMQTTDLGPASLCWGLGVFWERLEQEEQGSGSSLLHPTTAEDP